MDPCLKQVSVALGSPVTSHIDRRPQAPMARHTSIVIDVASTSTGPAYHGPAPIHILGARDRAFTVLLDRISHVRPSRNSEAVEWRRCASRPSPTGTKNYTLTPLRKATKVSLTRVRLSPTRRGGGVDGLDSAATIMMLVHSG